MAPGVRWNWEYPPSFTRIFFKGRGGAGGGGGWRRCRCLRVLLPGQGSAAFGGANHRRHGGVQQRFVEHNCEADFVTCLVKMLACGQPESESAAQRRRGFRLRAALRHEQESIATALATALLHSAGPWKKKVEMHQTSTSAEEEEEHEKHDAQGDTEMNHAPRRQTTPTPTAEVFELSFEEELGGFRTDRLHGGSGPQDRDQQRIMEQIIAPVIDFLVLQIAQQLEGAGAVWEPIPVPQMVEQLVESDDEVGRRASCSDAVARSTCHARFPLFVELLQLFGLQLDVVVKVVRQVCHCCVLHIPRVLPCILSRSPATHLAM